MDYLYTFLIGGGICVIGQVLMDRTKLTTPRVLVILVLSGVVLQALQLYEPLVNLAHQGATVPLPGFGYALAKGAIEGAESGIIGVIQGALKATAAGITVAVAWGYLLALCFNPKPPK
ncbi:MAG: stage V sporulation protein AE [Firmicutes bacterium]|nr:stage V sporulation protein AE [Bacillota bacterium]